MMNLRNGSSTSAVVVVLLFTLVCTVLAHEEWSAEQNADRVEALPGQPPVDFAMYSGYITVNSTAGRALFYYFVEAEEEPGKKSLMLWLNGGPGCSSLGYGFAEELGPFFIRPGGQNLTRNPHSGNRVANIIFLESPAGVGFSYSNDTNDLFTPGDKQTANDNYAFLLNWFERFPQYKGRPLYLTGESYAGYFVPELAQIVYEANQGLPVEQQINFKGFMVGNPSTDVYNDNRGYVDFLYYHAMISDETYAQIKKDCIFSDSGQPVSDACYQVLYNTAPAEFGNIDAYDIYSPACLDVLTAGNQTVHNKKSVRKFQLNPLLGHMRKGYNPCSSNDATIYYNRPDVQKAIHANTSGIIPYPWNVCSQTLYEYWGDSAISVLPVYQELLAGGLRIWVYSGDVDSVVPVTGTRYSLAALNLTTVVPWYPWYSGEQVGGRSFVYKGNLTFVTVRGAGHEVPLLKRAQFLQTLKGFLSNTLLPANPY